MSKIIAVFNQAGGVGKTTLTLNLGYQLAQLDRKVLLVDLDPQGSLTEFLGVESVEQTPHEALIDDEPLTVLKEIWDVDLVPTDIRFSNTELQLTTADYREERLKDALKPVAGNYDYCLIDCPSYLGNLTMNALVAATHILIPISTKYKSYAGADLLLQTISRVRKRGNRNLKIAGFIPTMYEALPTHDRRILAGIQELSQVGTVFPKIPKSTEFDNASELHKPLAAVKSSHPNVRVLAKIAKQLDKQCQKEATPR